MREQRLHYSKGVGVDERTVKVAVVTGGASGIGRACRERLEDMGTRVYVIDRNGEPPLDVIERSGLETLAARIRSSAGGVDILINAAGILTENRPVDDITSEEMLQNYSVNVLGTLTCCQVFGPLLRSRKGAVVNVTSQAALASLPWQAAYSASKGAVVTLTRSLAIDWADSGVRVNCVAPGFTFTPMTADFLTNESFVKAVTRRIPLGRLLKPQEIANAILFLAGPDASAITGITLPVDGGWTAGEPALEW